MSRRIASFVVALSCVVVAACGDDEPDTSPSSTAAAAAPATQATAATPAANEPAGWTWVDGSGTTTTLDAVPTRIVAHGSAAAALIPLGIRPVGIYADTPIADDLALRNLDLTGIEIVGEEWGIINLEAVAALHPDLIVAEWWPVEQAYSGLEPGTAAANQQMSQIAPVVGVAQGPSIVTMIADYRALATSLGADLDSPEIAADSERFDAAVAAFQAAIASKPGLTALAVSPTTESLYVAVPEYAAELSDFMTWGLDLVVPTDPDEGFEYWQTLSWENAGTYQADLVMIDERGYPSNLDVAKAQPTWQTITAAANDAVAVWPAYWLRNHRDYATAIDLLTASIEAADEHLVP